MSLRFGSRLLSKSPCSFANFANCNQFRVLSNVIQHAPTPKPEKPPSQASLDAEEATKSVVKISKAMRSYLERAQKHEQFMSVARHEFDMGKRHLANMMGWNPETITQKDIDVSFITSDAGVTPVVKKRLKVILKLACQL